MLLKVDAHPLADQARDAANLAAAAAGVTTADVSDMESMRAVADLLTTVWGTSPQGAPIPPDLLRSISHAGCNVTGAYDANGRLCGAAAAIVSPMDSATYSLIAGVLPRFADQGVGFAVKQHQRAWALARGLTSMAWTFDPLVSRNARFNLTKLGAHANGYEVNFYGLMEDEINANDESDRLVAVWPLDSARSVDCSEKRPTPVDVPEFTDDQVRELGPDHEPAVVDVAGTTWVRVPHDIVRLRSENPAQAQAWRLFVRGIFASAFSAGQTASGVTRTGWYQLTKGEHE